MHPAACWGHYDESFDECKTKCKVAHICKPVAARVKAGKPPVQQALPPQPTLPEPVPEPDPMDYFLQLAESSGALRKNRKMSNDKTDVKDLLRLNKETQKMILYARILILKDGSGRIRVDSAKGKVGYIIDSIEAAEKALATL
jgi:hypothetical protein